MLNYLKTSPTCSCSLLVPGLAVANYLQAFLASGRVVLVCYHNFFEQPMFTTVDRPSRREGPRVNGSAICHSAATPDPRSASGVFDSATSTVLAMAFATNSFPRSPRW